MSDPGRTRTRAFLLTLASGQGLTLCTMLVAFLATPVILRNLGAERYGMWRVLEVWLAYVALIPLCVSQAAGFLLVPILAKGDRERLRRFAATLAVVGGCVAALVSIAGLALVPALPWLVAGTSELAGESREAFLIALIVAVPLAPFLLMRSVLDADQKGYLLNAVIAVQSLTVTGVAVWLAISGQGLPGQALAAAAGMAVQAGLFAVLAYRGYSWARPGWPAWAESAALLRRTSSLLILAILGGIAARAEFPLVNVLYGPEETARYALGQRLFLIYAGLVAVIGNSIWAPAADLFHRGELQRMAVHLERALRGALVAGAAGAVAIAAVTPQFLRLWVGEGYDPGGIARTGFAVVFPLLGLNILLTWVLTATGQTRAMLASTTLYCLVTVGAGAGLGSMYGPGGVAWGMALGVGSAVAINLMVASTVFRLDAVGVSLRLGLTAAIGALFGFAVSQVVSLLPGMGWLELIGALAAGWLGFLALGWFVILTRDDRRELRSRLRRR